MFESGCIMFSVPRLNSKITVRSSLDLNGGIPQCIRIEQDDPKSWPLLRDHLHFASTLPPDKIGPFLHDLLAQDMHFICSPGGPSEISSYDSFCSFIDNMTVEDVLFCIPMNLWPSTFKYRCQMDDCGYQTPTFEDLQAHISSH